MRRSMITGVLLGVAGACGGGDSSGPNPPPPPPPPPASQPTSMAVQAGNNQTARVGDQVPIVPAVQVRDQFQNPMPGVTVTFSVLTGGGIVTGPAQVTDAQGIARVGSWTLGLFDADQSLRATGSGLPQVTFTATGASGWTYLNSNGIAIAGVLAEPGSLFGAGTPWSATLLGSAPVLGVACSATTGEVYVAVSHSNLITESGIVAWAFDNAALQGDLWLELGPDYDILIHPGSQTELAAFIAAMALSRTFTITFRDWRGSVLYAPVFDVRGLALELPRLLVNC